MDSQLYKTLKYIVIVMVAGFIAFSIYDTFIAGDDEYALTMGAAHRFFEDKDFERSLKEFESALKLVPDDSSSIYGIAISQMQLGRNVEALKSFTLAIEGAKESKDKAFIVANRGILHDRMGLYQQALEDYKRALQLEPETTEGPGMISRLLHNQSKKPPTILDRARYLQSELAKPENERLLAIPEIDQQQRTEKVQ